FNPEFEAPSHTVTPAPAEQIKKEDTIRQSNVGNPSKESQSTVSEKTADKPSKHPKTIERPTSESKAKTDESSMVVYAIQIGVFSRKLKEGSAAFKGISPIRELVSNGHYKYFCFESGSFQTTKENFKKIAGIFPDAFIVSIDGEKVKMVWENKRSKK
ncbi:MAG: hypothetical protein LWW85_15255, partial [Marinilabiliales bacterium]|nr:hypothetical protein [Marinilabiliales bacterium]